MSEFVERIRKQIKEGEVKIAKASEHIEEELDEAKASKQSFLKKYTGKTIRGDGEELGGSSNEWKLIRIAELFNYNPEILSILDNNADDILNRSDSSLIILQIEQIRLLKNILGTLNERNTTVDKKMD